MADSSLLLTNLQHSTVNPKFLHSNSTSHTWAFGALAELVDNATDSDVGAKHIYIDVEFDESSRPRLTFTDDGAGMDADRLHRMLGFGHSHKELSSIGRYGNGFKSGSMKLGRDAMVFTRCGTSKSIGFLSQTFLAAVNAQEVLVPIATWFDNGSVLPSNDSAVSIMTAYSPFKTPERLLQEFDQISSRTGSRIVIFNLRTQEQSNKPEIDFEEDPLDFRITTDADEATGELVHFARERPFQKGVDVPLDYSLRAYLSVLYLKPRMHIFLRGQEVDQRPISTALKLRKTYSYKPIGSDKAARILFGFNAENLSLYGMMLYHRKRLIKPYVRVGMQLSIDARGTGVIGVVQCEILEPTHNKQDFIDNASYRALLRALGLKLSLYWGEKIPAFNLRGSVPLRKYIEQICNAAGDGKTTTTKVKAKAGKRKLDTTPKARRVKKPKQDPAKPSADPTALGVKVENGRTEEVVAEHVAEIVDVDQEQEPEQEAVDQEEDAEEGENISEDDEEMETEDCWMQCENPECLKWRKLPRDVEEDKLPQLFFCHMNMWDPAHRQCSDPQEPGHPEERKNHKNAVSLSDRFARLEAKQQEIMERVSKAIAQYQSKLDREKKRLQSVHHEYGQFHMEMVRIAGDAFPNAQDKTSALNRAIANTLEVIDNNMPATRNPAALLPPSFSAEVVPAKRGRRRKTTGDAKGKDSDPDIKAPSMPATSAVERPQRNRRSSARLADSVPFANDPDENGPISYATGPDTSYLAPQAASSHTVYQSAPTFLSASLDLPPPAAPDVHASLWQSQPPPSQPQPTFMNGNGAAAGPSEAAGSSGAAANENFVLLQFINTMYKDGALDAIQKSRVKDLILRGDERIKAAGQVYMSTRDDEDLRETVKLLVA